MSEEALGREINVYCRDCMAKVWNAYGEKDVDINCPYKNSSGKCKYD